MPWEVTAHLLVRVPVTVIVDDTVFASKEEALGAVRDALSQNREDAELDRNRGWKVLADVKAPHNVRLKATSIPALAIWEEPGGTTAKRASTIKF